MKLLDLRQLELSLTLTLRRRSLQARIPSLPPAPVVITTPSAPPSRPIGPGLARALPSRSNVIQLRARKAG